MFRRLLQESLDVKKTLIKSFNEKKFGSVSPVFLCAKIFYIRYECLLWNKLISPQEMFKNKEWNWFNWINLLKLSILNRKIERWKFIKDNKLKFLDDITNLKENCNKWLKENKYFEGKKKFWRNLKAIWGVLLYPAQDILSNLGWPSLLVPT